MGILSKESPKQEEVGRSEVAITTCSVGKRKQHRRASFPSFHPPPRGIHIGGSEAGVENSSFKPTILRQFFRETIYPASVAFSCYLSCSSANQDATLTTNKTTPNARCAQGGGLGMPINGCLQQLQPTSLDFVATFLLHEVRITVKTENAPPQQTGGGRGNRSNDYLSAD